MEDPVVYQFELPDCLTRARLTHLEADSSRLTCRESPGDDLDVQTVATRPDPADRHERHSADGAPVPLAASNLRVHRAPERPARTRTAAIGRDATRGQRDRQGTDNERRSSDAARKEPLDHSR